MCCHCLISLFGYSLDHVFFLFLIALLHHLLHMATRDPVEPQAISDGASKCGIAWTGGKDCNLALLHAWRNPSLEVVALIVFRPEKADFRAHPIPLMNLQASALGLPLLHVVIRPKTTATETGHEGKKEDPYKAAYVEGLCQLYIDHGIKVVATGDMDLVGKMQRNWVEECCEAVTLENVDGPACGSMRAYLPLWQCDREEVLQKILAEGLRVVFSCVKSPWFDSSWIGRSLDSAALAEMRQLRNCESKTGTESDAVKPLDLCGENGEFHTMCLDGPLYTTCVDLRKAVSLDVEELVNQKGQRDGERWWCMAALVEADDAGKAKRLKLDIDSAHETG